MTTVLDPGPSRLVPLIWLFLATIQSKIDNEEAIYPFFRLALFFALPFALLYLAQCVMRARFTTGRWLALACFSYLILYPFGTMAFGSAEDKVRHIKDALYILSLYIVYFFFARRYFLGKYGQLDIQALGRFLVLFALLESAIAVMMLSGLSFGLDFEQALWLDGRLHGLMGTPSHLAPVVSVAALFLVTQSLNSTNALKLAFLFIVLVMTGSRGALVGFFGAVFIYLVTQAQHLRLRPGAMVLIVLGVAVMGGAFALFPTDLEEIVAVAVRSDPDDWEKSRTVMWALRINEYVQMDSSTQLFGAGHRAIGQTFNCNIEYLVNYGAIYTLVFNILYGAVVVRFMLRSARARGPDHAYLLMVAVSTYLFMQGLNPTFYAFVHISNFLLIIMLITYFERFNLYNVIEVSRASSPEQLTLRGGV